MQAPRLALGAVVVWKKKGEYRSFCRMITMCACAKMGNVLS